MILGLFDKNIDQILDYNDKYFNQACIIIKKYDFSSIDDGRYELDGLNFYYLLTTYKTKKSEEKFPAESHKKYIDFQYIIYGEELIGYADPKCIRKTYSDYDEEKDLELFSSISNENFFLLKKDMFVVFYPYEIHRSGLAGNEIRSVRKVIFKIIAREVK